MNKDEFLRSLQLTACGQDDDPLSDAASETKRGDMPCKYELPTAFCLQSFERLRRLQIRHRHTVVESCMPVYKSYFRQVRLHLETPMYFFFDFW